MGFAVMVVGHLSQNYVLEVQQGINHYIEQQVGFAYTDIVMAHKTIYDVHSVHDFWSWYLKLNTYV